MPLSYEQNKKHILKYRDLHIEKINELQKGYAKNYYNNNKDICSKKNLEYYHWKRENQYEVVAKIFRKILIKNFD